MQQTQEWFEARRGRFTSSTIHKLLTDSKNGLSDGAKTYVYEKVAERLGGHKTHFENDATRWGNENEKNAIFAFELETGFNVQKCGFYEYENNSGGSPDGIISEYVIIEVKCPYESHIHIKYTDFKDQNDIKKHCKDYYAQMQMNMLVTNREYCYFISYDPRIQSNLNLFYMLVEKDDEFIENLKIKLQQATELFNKLTEKHNGKNN